MDTSLYGRRTNSTKLSLSTSNNPSSASIGDTPQSATRNATFPRRFGGDSSTHSKPNPLNTATTPGGSRIMSPGGPASSAFGLGSGAFSSFGAAVKTPKTTSNPFDVGFKAAASSGAAPGSAGAAVGDKSAALAARSSAGGSHSGARSSGAQAAAQGGEKAPRYLLRNEWVFWFRPPISKANGYIEYEKTLHPMASVTSAEDFFAVYAHLKRPSSLPLVSDYHLFRKGIRPIWEDAENRKGGKWIVRLKKGVADRYWEDLLFAIIGDQFSDASDEVCGAVLSVRNGEDILSVWARTDGGRVLKIRETMKRVLNLPVDTKLEWKSHDSSIQQRSALEESRREKPNNHHHHNNHNHNNGNNGHHSHHHHNNNNNNNNNNSHNHSQHHQSDRRPGKPLFSSRGTNEDQPSFANHSTP